MHYGLDHCAVLYCTDVLTTCNRQDDAGCSRCVAHIPRAGPFGHAAYRNWAADADREGLQVVACQHVLRQVFAEAIVGVVEAQALHDVLHLYRTTCTSQPAMQLLQISVAVCELC